MLVFMVFGDAAAMLAHCGIIEDNKTNTFNDSMPDLSALEGLNDGQLLIVSDILFRSKAILLYVGWPPLFFAAST